MTVARRRQRASASESGIGGGKKTKNRRGYLEECFPAVNGPIKTSVRVTNSSQCGRRDPLPPLPPSQRPPGALAVVPAHR